ncbi:CDP-glycerol glycerophosphotransferase family protein [Clostridium perfringens]
MCKLIYFIFKFFNKKEMEKNKIWLILERGDDAKDNGFIFYKYLNDIYKDSLNNDIRYIISSKSTDYDKVNDIGKVIHYGSLEHLYLLNKASYIISTHALTYIPDELRKFAELKLIKYNAKIIFLQHGIIKDYLPQLFYPKININLFICGAEPEYRYILENFKYPNNMVKYTGLARFDSLKEYKLKKQILIMPTWRNYLRNMSDEEFKKSEYYNKFKEIILDDEILEILLKYNYELIFYPHYEMQKYIKLFKSKNNFIKIASKSEYDVQTLLKESSLLITDYSSVFFDFAYMKKPIIYYQFDTKEFLEKHYKKGYFDYERDGFGEVVFTKESLKDSLIKALNNKCILENNYGKKIERFFKLNDSHNCERILNEIVKL